MKRCWPWDLTAGGLFLLWALLVILCPLTLVLDLVSFNASYRAFFFLTFGGAALMILCILVAVMIEIWRRIR